MMFTNHPYRHPIDFDRLNTFLSQIRIDIPHSHYLHRGDLTWQLFHMLADYPPTNLIQIWEDAQEHILGFVLLYPPYGFFDLQLHPQQRGTSLEAVMLAWAEEYLPASRSTLVNNHDTTRRSLLAEHGYVPQGEWQYLERLLLDPLPMPHLPPGFSVRSLASADEAVARAVVLGAAFGAPPQPERYRQFMHAPGYVHDLDIVAVAPDQSLAAFALCWVDPGNKVGQFEPVGTAPEFRQQGLGQAVLYEGLRRMRQHGAERVIVIVESAEEAACRLYASVGFEHQWNLRLYAKPVSIAET
jgi:mycothiol synthase